MTDLRNIRPSRKATIRELFLWTLYRRLRPRLWISRTAPKLQRLTDSAFLEHAGLPNNHDEAFGKLRDRIQQRLYFDTANRKEFFLSILTSLQEYDDILDEADEVVENKFETLGSGLVSLGDQIDWQKDFKSGISWPLDASDKLDLLQLGKPSDVKVPWELSRFHQVWWLGKAYWLTGSETYARKFQSLIEDWMQKNPPGVGVNWAIAMEASIRASNWVIGYSFFAGSTFIPATFWVRFFKWLYIHGVFIEQNLEYALTRGNHFLSNVAGLVILGTVFRETSFGDRWFTWGVRQLETEMNKQVYPDGVDYEKSTAYQRLVLELFYTPVILAERTGHTFSFAFNDRLRKMFHFVASFQRPDGSIPQFGDADDARLFRIRRKDDLYDFRHVLSIGGILFNDPLLRQGAGRFHHEALWLTGAEGFEKERLLRQQVASPGSVLFADGGFAVMRSEDTHVMVDVGDIGMEGKGGHGHNDTLSFEYWTKGHPIIVDPGTYAYTFDVDARQAFRSVKAHNTVMVDNTELVRFQGLWQIEKDLTRPKILRWSQGSEQDTLVAEHHAYANLHAPVVLRRTFEFDKAVGRLHVTDEILGAGTHDVTISFHLHPSCTVDRSSPSTFVIRCGESTMRLTTSEQNAAPEESWFSRGYGRRERNAVIRLRWRGAVPKSIRTTIEPVRIP